MRKWIYLLLSSTPLAMSAQVLTLEQCQREAEANYPLTKQRELISRSEAYTLTNISKAYLPQFSLSGQATYQSDVVEFPGGAPGMEIPTQNKDQYKAYIEMNQVILDGGAIRNQKETEKVRKEVARKSLEVELYAIRERVNSLFFGILIADAQLKQYELAIEDIGIALQTVEAQVRNGTALRSHADVLKAEELKVRQQQIALRNNRIAYVHMLGLFLDSELPQDIQLEKPMAPLLSGEINRPELALFDSRDKLLELGKETIATVNRPKLNFFVQGGYGNPALNFLSDKFEPYYIGGLKVSWSFSGLYTAKKEKQIIDLDKLEVASERETFLFNLNHTLKQQDGDINKYAEMLAQDDNIIQLRANVKKAASAQLENGVITPSDYLEELNNENEAKQDKIVHEMQLLLAQYNQKTTKGN